jgi:hypothetical protein
MRGIVSGSMPPDRIPPAAALAMSGSTNAYGAVRDVTRVERNVGRPHQASGGRTPVEQRALSPNRPLE